MLLPGHPVFLPAIINKTITVLAAVIAAENGIKIPIWQTDLQETIIVNAGEGKLDGQEYEAGILLNFNQENKGFINIELLMVVDKSKPGVLKKCLLITLRIRYIYRVCQMEW